MRIPPRNLVVLVLSLAWPISVGCSSSEEPNTSGVGGSPGPSTGDLPIGMGGDGAVGVGSGAPRPGVFARAYGDAEDQHASAVAMSDSGDTALVGTAKGTIDFGNIPWTGSATDTDVVVAKISREGQSLWSRRYGDSCAQRGGAVAHAPSGNVVLAGDYCGKMDFGTTTIETQGGEVDLFVAEIDTFGDDVYSRSFGGKGAQIARAAAVDSDGNAILAGSFDQGFDDGGGETPSAGMDDAFVIKLDPKGNLLWSVRFGGPESDIPRGIAVDATGNILLGGSFGGSVDFGGGPLTASAGHSSGFVLALDPSGKHLWSKSLGAEADADAVVNGVAVSITGTIAAAGAFAGTADFGSGPVTSAGAEDVFLAVMDGAGKPTWGRTFGGPKSQRGTGVAFGTNEDVGISGTSDEIIDLDSLGPSSSVSLPSTALEPSMVYGVRFTALGSPRRASAVESTSPMESVGIGLVEIYGIVLAGSFQEKLSFRVWPVEAAGAWDMFLVSDMVF